MNTACDHVIRQIEGTETVYCAKCEPVEHISLTDTAKLIRAALKAAFPDTKFSVRSKSYSGGCSITIWYDDGPPSRAVDAIAKRFEGASFDGMQDLKEYHNSILNGRPVKFGPDYVFVNRHVSESHWNRIGEILNERISGLTSYVLDRYRHQALSTWDARWETLDRAVTRGLHQGFTL